jgi:hypothetical protein
MPQPSTFGDGDCVSQHTALIFDRGGRNRLWQLVDLSSVTWNRARGKTTEGRVVISGKKSCEAQQKILSSIEPHRHELVIFRGDERVWEGPIIQVGAYSDRVEIIAHDVKEYLDATPLTKEWPNSDGGGPDLMGDRLAEIIDYELTTPYVMVTGTGGATKNVTVPRWETIDPPINIIDYLDVRPGTVLTRSTTEAFQMFVGEHIDNLAVQGMNYTVIGRSLVLWDTAVPLGTTRTLTEADFYGEVEVIASGTDQATIGHVIAQTQPTDTSGTPESPSVGNAGAADDYYGVWTFLHTLDQEEGATTPTSDEMNSQAQRLIVGASPTPTEIRVPNGSGLRLSYDLTVQQLVPGVVMPVLAVLNLRPVSQEQILDTVAVSESHTGETVQVSLVPSGSLEEVLTRGD